MGWQRASWFLYSGDWMDADACKAAGLALEVAPDDDLMSTAMSRAHMLAAKSLTSLIATKRAMTAPRRDALHEANRLEMQQLLQLLDGPACEEGLRAFFEKRQPNFLAARL